MVVNLNWDLGVMIIKLSMIIIVSEHLHAVISDDIYIIWQYHAHMSFIFTMGVNLNFDKIIWRNIAIFGFLLFFKSFRGRHP